MIVPAGPVRSALRNRQRYVTFCSRKCNRIYVAKEGLKAQEAARRD